LREAGADVLFAPSEPQSTHGAVVDALDAREGITAFAWEGMTDEEFDEAQHDLLEEEPDFILDDGCELIAKVHAEHPDVAADVIGGGEQTTAGITRLEAMEEEGILQFPVYGVNDTPMKHFFDNVHGTGSPRSPTSPLRRTPSSPARTSWSVATATAAAASPAKRGDGRPDHRHRSGSQKSPAGPHGRPPRDGHGRGERGGDLFISATGNREVLRDEHFERMQDGAILANLRAFRRGNRPGSPGERRRVHFYPEGGVTQYHMPDGRRLNLLAEGRLVNLTGPFSQGHPAEVMDTTFAMMFVAAYDMLVDGPDLEPGLYNIPDRLDRAVAERETGDAGVSIDDMTESQQAYTEEWEHPDSSF